MDSMSDSEKYAQDTLKRASLPEAVAIDGRDRDALMGIRERANTPKEQPAADGPAKSLPGLENGPKKTGISIETSAENMGDSEIAAAIAYAFKWNWGFSGEKVIVKVENGWVTLNGELAWDYQKEAAKNIAGALDGVKGVTNNINVEKEQAGTTK
jgi:osmotically-inducible protein OsmY